MGMLSGKRALIVGVATDRSIAWGIAQAFHEQGATLAFSYANDRFRERVEPLAASIGSTLLMPLDVSEDVQIEQAFARLKGEWEEEYRRWQGRDLSARRYVYVWADGVYLQARITARKDMPITLTKLKPQGNILDWRHAN